MDTNKEVITIKWLSAVFIFVAFAFSATPVFITLFPYFALGGPVEPFQDYMVSFYQEMPFSSISLCVQFVVYTLLLITFVGVFRLKEIARKVLILISVVGAIAYVLLFTFSEISVQELPFPVLEASMFCAFVFIFTRPKIKEQFK